MIFQDRIHPQLRAWYDASAGFDFDHLETFVPQCNAAELANLKEDPAVSARDVMVPGPKNAPDVKVRIYTPNPRPSEPLPCLFFYHGGGYLFGSVYRQEARRVPPGAPVEDARPAPGLLRRPDLGL